MLMTYSLNDSVTKLPGKLWKKKDFNAILLVGINKERKVC